MNSRFFAMADDELDVRAFANEFRAFMKALQKATPPPEPTALARRLNEHLGADPGELPVTVESLPAYEQANVQAAMDAYLAGEGITAELIGIVGSGREHQGFADLVDAARKHGQYDVGAVDYATVSVGVGKERACVNFGLYLIATPEHRLAALIRLSGHRRAVPEMLIEVMCSDSESAR